MLYAAAMIGARRAANRKHAGARALSPQDRTRHHHIPMPKRRRWRRSSSETRGLRLQITAEPEREQ